MCRMLSWAKLIPCIEKTPIELFWWKLKKSLKNRKIDFFGTLYIFFRNYDTDASDGEASRPSSQNSFDFLSLQNVIFSIKICYKNF